MIRVFVFKGGAKKSFILFKISKEANPYTRLKYPSKDIAIPSFKFFMDSQASLGHFRLVLLKGEGGTSEGLNL